MRLFRSLLCSTNIHSIPTIYWWKFVVDCAVRPLIADHVMLGDGGVAPHVVWDHDRLPRRVGASAVCLEVQQCTLSQLDTLNSTNTGTTHGRTQQSHQHQTYYSRIPGSVETNSLWTIHATATMAWNQPADTLYQPLKFMLVRQP